MCAAVYVEVKTISESFLDFYFAEAGSLWLFDPVCNKSTLAGPRASGC